MQRAIPYSPRVPPAAATDKRSGLQPPATGDGQAGISDVTKVDIQRMVVENPVVVFGQQGCCMCHVVTRLLLGFGVNPTSYEVADEDEAALVVELSRMANHPEATCCNKNDKSNENGSNVVQLPVVFVGGQLFGGLDRIIATHISGELVPILKEVRALWL